MTVIQRRLNLSEAQLYIYHGLPRDIRQRVYQDEGEQESGGEIYWDIVEGDLVTAHHVDTEGAHFVEHRDFREEGWSREEQVNEEGINVGDMVIPVDAPRNSVALRVTRVSRHEVFAQFGAMEVPVPRSQIRRAT